MYWESEDWSVKDVFGVLCSKGGRVLPHRGCVRLGVNQKCDTRMFFSTGYVCGGITVIYSILIKIFKDVD